MEVIKRVSDRGGLARVIFTVWACLIVTALLVLAVFWPERIAEISVDLGDLMVAIIQAVEAIL